MDKNIQKMMGLNPDIPQIKLRDIESLVMYDRNARTHSPAQVEQLQALLLEYGWTNSVLVDEMGVVAGHGRCMAAAAIYKRGEQIRFPNGTPIPIGMVPTIDCSGWTPQQRRAYILADNRSALSAGWDEEMLKLELVELDEAGFDLSLTAFDEDELAELLADTELVLPEDKDPDDIPPERDDTVSVPGDVWICGPHKIACGDSTDVCVWDALMQGARADVCITDPPYGVDLGRKNKLIDKASGGQRYKTGSIANDKMTDVEFADLIFNSYSALFTVLKPGATIYVSHSDKFGGLFRDLFEKAGFKFSQSVIWKKSQLVLGMAPYQPIHEPILVGRKPGSKHRWYGGRKQTTVMEVGEGGYISRDEQGRWLIKVGDAVLVVDGDAKLEEHPLSVINVPKPARSDLHPSTKPVDLWERLLKNSARPGDIVVDGFNGSGTTVIAADRLGLIARVIDLEPRHVDTAIRRWQDYSGRKAVHAVTGEEFPVDGVQREAPPPQVDEGPDIF